MAKLIIGLGNKCIDASGAGITNGTPIILWDQSGDANQMWSLTSEGYIESSLDTSKCLDIQNGAAVNGTPIILYEKTGNPNQKWFLDSNGYLTSQLDSNKCIDASGAESRSGTAIILWDKNNGINQKWHFEDFLNPSGQPTYPEGSLVKGNSNAIYVIENGHRRLIPDIDTFNAMGFVPDRVLFITDAELNQIPLGARLPHTVRLAVSVKTNLDHNRWMESKIRLLTSTGDLMGSTRTWSATWLNGFKAVAVVLGSDNNDDVLFAKTQETYANGTLFGACDNTSQWLDIVDVALAQRTTTLTIVHGIREVTNLNILIDGIILNGTKLADFASKVGAVIKEFDSKSS